MDKKSKYELIVKIKELLLETDIKDAQELLDTRKISLNTSKVMSLIYSDDTKVLPNLFENNVNKYKELKREENKYIETLLLREKQLKEFEKYVSFDIRLNYHNHLLNRIPAGELTSNELKKIYDSLQVDAIKLDKNKAIYSGYYVFDEFTIDVYDEKKHNFYQHILDVLDLDHTKGIFNFIDFVFSNQEEQFFNNNSNSDASYDEELAEVFTIFDTDEYRRYIASYYDYYYLYNSENNIQKWSFVKDNNLFSYIAYKCILSDLLEYLYTMDLTKEEKRQYNIDEKHIDFESYEELQDLQNAQKRLLKYIAISENKEHLTELLNIIDYPKQRVSELSNYFKDLGLLTNGGYDELKNLLRNHPEWFTKNVTKVTKSN